MATTTNTKVNPATLTRIIKPFSAGSVPTRAHGGNCNLQTYPIT